MNDIKISELEETNYLEGGSCFPLVQENETKKVSFDTLKNELPQTEMMVGTTTTGEPGTDANVFNSGTPTAPILNFTIPKGEKGDTGPQGPRGFKGDTVHDVYIGDKTNAPLNARLIVEPIKGSATGSKIQLTDSANDNILKLVLEGNSDINNVCVRSMLKDSDIHTSNNSLYYLGKNYWYSTNNLSECIELEANTTYTFSCKIYTSDNKITLMDSSKTALTRVTLTGDYTFTTTQKCWLHYYSNGNTEQPKWQLINCGTQIDDLSYGNWLINKITGKNLLKLDDKLIAGYTTTVQGITYTFNQNGSITISGATGANISSIVLLGDNLNNYVTKRWHEDEDIVVNFSVAGLALNCRTTNSQCLSLANAKGRDVGVIYLSVNPNTTIDTTIYPYVTYKTDSNFEPYKETISKLNLQDNELVKIDEVSDEVDMVTGVLTKRIGKSSSGSYYVLETPETIQLEAQKIELFEGENNITNVNSMDMNINYITDKTNLYYQNNGHIIKINN